MRTPRRPQIKQNPFVITLFPLIASLVWFNFAFALPPSVIKSNLTSIQNVLQDVLKVKKRILADQKENEIQEPLLNIHLRCGFGFSGFLEDLHENKEVGTYTAVFRLRQNDNKPYSVCYVAAQDIAAVIICDQVQFEKSKFELYWGKPISSFQLQREIKTLSQTLTTLLGKSVDIQLTPDQFEDSDQQRALVLRILELTVSALKDLAKETIGKNVISKALRRMEVVNQEKGLQLSNQTLYINPNQLVEDTRLTIEAQLNKIL